MGRSKPRRSGGEHFPAAPPLAPLVSPPAAEGVLLEPLAEPGDEARRLFTYVGAWAPPPSPGEVVWGARLGEAGRLIGAVLLERRGATGMLHGPVVVLGRDAEGGVGDQRRDAEGGAGDQRDEASRADPVEIAAQLLGALLPHATARGIHTLFARPQGLDRVWVRFGFIPVPEADPPSAFKGRPGTGLFAWRGGTALWSSRKPENGSEPG